MKLTLVIVDDNPADRAMLRRMLRSSDLVVDLVEIGTAQELFALSLEEIDCVVLDNRLPDRNGIDALLELSKGRQYPPCPMIIMTGQGDEHTAAQAFKAGANDYLIKDTLTPNGLTRVLVNAMDKWHSEDAMRNDWETQKNALRVAERDNQAKTRVIAHLSHQLRISLTAILGFSQLIEDGELGDDKAAWEKYKVYASDINQSAQLVFNLMTGILELAQVESGEARIIYATFDPRQTLRETVELFARQIKAAGIVLETDDQDAPASVCSDDRVLKSIMTNLLSNAISITPAGQSVQVRLCALDGNRYQFSVTDKGIGRNPESLSNLSRTYEQYQDRRVISSDAAGLGLHLVDALVKSLNGSLTVQTTPDQGMTVTVVMPNVMIDDQER
ncbi:MAG: hybrid sensor histidine kinase/response regulator [Rhodospirillales bacterium]